VGYAVHEVPVTVRGDTIVTLVLTPAVVALPGVAVEGQRPTPLPGMGSVTVVPPRELDIHRGQSLAELIASVPGTGMVTTGPAIAKPTLRGMTGERVLILNDEVPLYGQQWGVEHAPELDPLLVESVEVLRGMAAVQYGSNALAGVIRFVPKPLPLQPGMHWEGRLEGFSANRQGAVAFWGEGATQRWGWQVLGSARKAADMATPHYTLANTAFEQYNGHAAVQALLGSQGLLRARLQVYQARLGIFAGMHLGSVADLERALQSSTPLVQRPVSYDIRPPYQQVRHVLTELAYEGQLGAVGQLSAVVSWQQNRRREYDAHRFWNDSLQAVLGGRPAYDVTLTTWNLRTELARMVAGGQVHAVLDARREGSVSEGSQRFVPNFRSYTLGAGAWYEWTGHQWRVLAGARVDATWLAVWRTVAGTWQKSQHWWSGSAVSAALQRTWREWDFRIGVAGGWRAPTALELYANGIHHGAAIFESGDSTLPTERAWMGELRVGYHTTAWHAEVTGFLYGFPRFIASLPTGKPVLTIRGAFPGFQYQAVPALIVGVEAAVQAELLPWLRTELWADFLRGRQTQSGQPLYGIPPARVALRAHAHLPSPGRLREPFVELQLSAVGRAADAPLDFAPAPPGYALWHAAAGATLTLGPTELLLSAEVRNLFNRAYRDYSSRLRYFADEPGRMVIVRLGWRW